MTLSTTLPFRTLIIEDQGLFRSLLASHLQLQADFELVGQASDGPSGLTVFRDSEPDLVLLDIVLPGLDGFAVAKQILSESPETGILAITSQMDEQTTRRIHELGFKGYVEKEKPIEVLLEAMLTVAEGGFYFTQLVRENRYRLHSDRSALRRIMSDREHDILNRVVQGATSQSIAEALNISRRTVENHRYRIMKKLNIQTLPELVQFALKNDLL